MSWFRNLLRSKIDLSHRTPDELARWRTSLSLIYFFSASTLGFYMWTIYDKNQTEKATKLDLLMGKPVLEDEARVQQLLKSGRETLTVAERDEQKGWVNRVYHRDEYIQKLQREAYGRAYEAQKAELEAGRPLPPGALVLVEDYKAPLTAKDESK